MKKRRSYIIPLALLLTVIIGLNIWAPKSAAGTDAGKTAIEHTQLEFFVPDNRILLQADISDPTGIAEARLYFGTSKDTKKLVFSEMKPQGSGGSHVGTIPAPASDTDKLYYCFLAVNNNGKVTKTGLFEMTSSRNIGFVPTWQTELTEHSEALVLSIETAQDELLLLLKTPSTHLEGFSDNIVVNTVDPNKRYFAAKDVERVAGLSTIDGGTVAPEGAAEGKWSTKKKAAVIGGVIVAGGVGAAIAASDGGGDGDDCTFTIFPTSETFPCGGGSYSVDVTTQRGCSWDAVSNDDWITVTSIIYDTGINGSGTVHFSVGSNLITPKRELRSGTITIAGETFTVTQDECIGCGDTGCKGTFEPSSQSIPCGGGSYEFTLTTTGCGDDPTAYLDDSEWQGWTVIDSEVVDSNGTVEITVSYHVGQAGTEQRSSVMRFCDNTYTVTQDGCEECNYDLSSTSASFPCGGGTDSVNVTAGIDCNWTAESSVDWVDITSGDSGTGDGTVTYTVASNLITPRRELRNGEITLKNALGETVNTLSISQDECVGCGEGGCVGTFDPPTQSAPCEGGSYSFTLTMTGCGDDPTAYWNDSGWQDWTVITDEVIDSNGTVTVTVFYDVEPAGTQQRVSTIRFCDNTYTVTQEGCEECDYALSPTSASAPCEGGTDSIGVTVQSGCGWNAASNEEWITVTSGSSGTGNGTVEYSVDENPETTQREGTLLIAGETFTVTQEGCSTAESKNVIQPKDLHVTGAMGDVPVEGKVHFDGGNIGDKASFNIHLDLGGEVITTIVLKVDGDRVGKLEQTGQSDWEGANLLKYVDSTTHKLKFIFKKKDEGGKDKFSQSFDDLSVDKK